MNTLEDFFQWEDGVYDLVVFDEWQANQHSIQFLNQFLDGQEMWIRMKGTQALKTQRVPVILLTNFSEDLNFPSSKMMEKLTFLSRVTWLTLQAPLNLDQMLSRDCGTIPLTVTPILSQLNGGSTRSTDMGDNPSSPEYTPCPWPNSNPSDLFTDEDLYDSEDEEDATQLP